MTKMKNSNLDKIDQHVEAVQNGDGDAYRFVVEQLISRVRIFVAGRSIPGIDVDDIVQQAFVEAYTSIKDYKLGTDFAAWVITISRYQLLQESSRLRRLADYHSKYVPIALANEMEAQLHAGNEIEESRMQFLKECLKEIPQKGRGILKERYESTKSIAQISEEMGRSAGSIRKQLYKLRKQLHECVSIRLAKEDHS